MRFLHAPRARTLLLSRAPLAGAALLLVSAVVGVAAAPVFGAGLGSIDSSFGSTNPTHGTAVASGSGKVYANGFDPLTVTGGSHPIVVGGYQTVGGVQEMAVARFNPGGTTDTSFDTSGVATSSFGSGDTSTAYAISVNSDGSVVAAGQDVSSTQINPAIAEFSASGALTWSSDELTTSTISSRNESIGQFNAVGVDSAGRILAAGVVGVDSSTGSFIGTRLVVARFSPSSSSVSLDTTFGSGGYYLAPLTVSHAGEFDTVTGLAVYGSGDVIVVGNTPLNNGCTEAFVLKVNSGGTVATGFGSNGVQVDAGPSGSTCTSVSANTVQLGSGASMPAVLVGGGELPSGSPPSSGQSLLFGLNSDGSFDSSFGTSNSGVVVSAGGSGTMVQINSIGLVPSSIADPTPSSIVVSGLAYKPVGSVSSPAIGVARYELSGGLDTSFGTAGTSVALPCAVVTSCGAAVSVQPNADIDVSGGLADGALSVAQLVQREVSVESSPTISVSGVTAPNAQFAIVYNGPALVTKVTVAYTTVTGTAVAGTNYQATSGTATFAPGGATTIMISVPVFVPAGATGAVTFSLQLSNPIGAGVGLASGTATINYPPPATTTGNSGSVGSGSSGGSSSGSGGSSTTPTTTPGSPTVTLPTPQSVPPAPGKGYWVVTSTGTVTSLGDAPDLGSVAAKSLSGKIVGLAATANGLGYWLVSSKGQVYAFGNATAHGSVAKKRLHGLAVALRPTASGRGYWIASTSGQVFAFGDAKAFGSPSKPAGSIVGFTTLSTGKGYWLASSKGNVYAFGSAKSHGSKSKPPSPVVAFAAKVGNGGYWLATRAGAVYAFGSARTYALPVVKTKTKKGTKSVVVKFDAPIAGFAPTPNGKGYWLISRKGTVYSFGDAGSYGSSGAGAVAVVTT